MCGHFQFKTNKVYKLLCVQLYEHFLYPSTSNVFTMFDFLLSTAYSAGFDFMLQSAHATYKKSEERAVQMIKIYGVVAVFN